MLLIFRRGYITPVEWTGEYGCRAIVTRDGSSATGEGDTQRQSFRAAINSSSHIRGRHLLRFKRYLSQ